MELRYVFRILTVLAPLVESRVLADTIASRNAETTTTISPVVFISSGAWSGDDGSWSTFILNIGTPAQYLEVLISTAGTQTVVITPNGCDGSTALNCEALRGGFFSANDSSSYSRNTAKQSINGYPLSLDMSLGYNNSAELGFDEITIGRIGGDGPTTKNQTITGISTDDFYMGSFGLNPRSTNFTSGDSIPSCMQHLVNQSLIPSTSWAYTAGNQYRFNDVFGSLTLGGYDSAKFIKNDLQYSFYPNSDRDLMVYIDAITTSSSFSRSSESSLLSNPIPAFLDSTLPYIWLPTITCGAFEKAFNLAWDETTQLYLLNETQHAALTALNPNVTFTIGNFTSDLKVNITLPYAAFDLEAQYPLVANTTRYFPLKRANDSTQYTLGRAFFQEAYVIADYDRGNFSVSQVRWDSNARQNIVTINSPTKNNIASSSSSSSSNKPPRFPTALIAGSIVTGIAGTSLVFGIIYWIFIYKPRKLLQAQLAAASSELSERKERDASSLDSPVSQSAEDIEGAGGGGGEKAGSNYSLEADSKEIEIFEMPANEEVAKEVQEESPYHREPPPYSAPPRDWSWVAEQPVALASGDGERSDGKEGGELGVGVWRMGEPGEGVMGRGGDGWDEVEDEDEIGRVADGMGYIAGGAQGVPGGGGDGWDEIEDMKSDEDKQILREKR